MARDAFDIQLGLRRVVYAYGSSATSIPYVPFGIRRADLRSHLYVVGKTGCGKSTLIKSIVSQAIAQGIGVAVLDPHGTLIEDILDEAIPGERIKDTIVFAPGDRDWPVSLNLLRCAKQPSQVASGLVDAFEGLFGYSWGPRLEYILYCIACECPEYLAAWHGTDPGGSELSRAHLAPSH